MFGKEIMTIMIKKQKNITLFFLSLFMLISCSPSGDKMYKETRSSMYTLTSITVAASSEEKAKKAIDAAFKELDRLEKLLNYYDKDSELAEINRNAGIKPVIASEDTIDIIEKALFVSESTDGAFDITMGPVISLWDFKEKKIPDKRKLNEKLSLIGYKNITLNKKDKTVFLKEKGIEINFGGILKGYAADRAAEMLKKNGIKSAIVAVAGDIKTFGIRPDGKAWVVGIQNPRASKGPDEIIGTVSINGQAISTSGDYERFFEKNGKRYHHLLSPKTGFPAGDCRSVTVITDKAAYTDAFATGLFILGLEKGMAVLKKLGFEGVFIDKNGKIYITEGIKDKIKFSNIGLK